MKIRDLVAQQLLAVCSETTQLETSKSTPKTGAPGAKLSEPQVQLCHQLINDIGWSTANEGDSGTKLLKVLSIVCGVPELAIRSNKHPVYEPFTVITMVNNNSTHSFMLTGSYIVTNGKSYYALHENGTFSQYQMEKRKTDFHLATPHQVKTCIEQLTDAQWKTIMRDDLFAPLVAAALDQEITIDNNPDKLNL